MIFLCSHFLLFYTTKKRKALPNRSKALRESMPSDTMPGTNVCNIPYATFSNRFITEKMNRAAKRQSTISVPHTKYNGNSPHSHEATEVR